MKRLINKLSYVYSSICSIIFTPWNKIKHIHELLKQMSPDDLLKAEPSNPYELLQSWLIDTMSFGLLTTFVINLFFGYLGSYNLVLVPGIGIGKYLVIETINEISNAVTGKVK